MKNALSNLIILSFLIFLCSCSYKLENDTDINGNKFKFKDYRNSKIAEEKRIEFFFNQEYHSEIFPVYSQTIITTCDSDNKGLCFQCDTAKIFLPQQFEAFKSIFQTGLIYSQFIFCETDSCRAPRSLVMIDTNGEKNNSDRT
jgi:hypothetical protein